MWKREEAVNPGSGQSTPTGQTVPSHGRASGSPQPEAGQQGGRDIVSIGKSVVIKGALTGSEDLTVEGQVEGKIELKDHVLTIGPNGKIRAQVVAKALVVLGAVTGNIAAFEKVDIRDGGSVDGDIVSPRLAIAEGAHFCGSVDMQRKSVQPGQAQQPRPATPPGPALPAPAAPDRPPAGPRSRAVPARG